MSKFQITLPPEMVEKYIQIYGNRPVKLPGGQINCGCPICMEGNSWGKKRRMFFYPETSSVYCFNCGASMSALKWIMTVTGKKFREVMEEARSYNFISDGSKTVFFTDSIDEQRNDQIPEGDLPKDTITIGSNLQRLYHSSDKMVNLAVQFVQSRKLDKAVNVPKYGISLKDFIHKNRLVIPFTDLDGKIPFYQTRRLIDDDLSPKYLSKRNAEKTVFGIDKVDLDNSYMFVTEGPLDSCFIENGVSLAGLKYTEYQINQLGNFFAHKKIWVLDNDFRKNDIVYNQYEKLISDGETVFIWPPDLSMYKDVNEYIIGENKTSMETDLILEHSYSGLRATQILKGLV